LLVFPLAFLWAPVRCIPFFWSCVEASFVVIGAVPLWLVWRRIARVDTRQHELAT
jgi:membrane protein implicated in regulation of membrane protease activity